MRAELRSGAPSAHATVRTRNIGDTVGLTVGAAVRWRDGVGEGRMLGSEEGFSVGTAVGAGECFNVGTAAGAEAAAEGARVGSCDDTAKGSGLGGRVWGSTAMQEFCLVHVEYKGPRRVMLRSNIDAHD